ncbi:MAG: glycosyltransferase [Leptolyngbyaceae bacterium]|nr:glycosyltransferase [Leptolyngbyaceae bacterium]
MNSPPRVSVVIPTYNCDRYLPEAIDSVLSQSYPDYEVLVIDDGSTDRTAEILDGYGDRLRAIHQTNQGVAIARNHGIQLARGEFIAFLDADDVWLPHKLDAQVKLFEACHQAGDSVGMVHSGWHRVDHTLQRQVEVCPWKTIPHLDLEGWLQWKPVLPSAMMFRRDWLLRADGFDPRFPPAEDTDLVLRLALMGCQTRWLEEVTTLYRQHHESAMHRGLPQARSLTRVIDHFFSRTDLPPTIRRIERQVQYSTHVWIAWYLYYTSHTQTMGEYLKKSLEYSHYSAIETVINWAESFLVFSKKWGKVIDMSELCKTPEWQSITCSIIHATPIEILKKF